MTTKEVLIAAKALIDTPGKWCKGAYKSNDGRYCAVGAADAVAPASTATRVVVYDALFDAMPRWYRSRKYIASKFNDARRTTHADVMAWFDRAIAAAGES